MRESPEVCSSGVVRVPLPTGKLGGATIAWHLAACPMNQALRLERVKEFNNIGKELGSGNGEVLSQLVRDLINRMMRFQQLPNLQSDGIETEADPLLNIQ